VGGGGLRIRVAAAVIEGMEVVVVVVD